MLEVWAEGLMDRHHNVGGLLGRFHNVWSLLGRHQNGGGLGWRGDGQALEY